MKFRIYSDDFHSPLLEKTVKKFIKSNVNVAVDVIFCDEEQIRTLNREKRDTDRVTDVLSFPALDGIKGKKINKKDFPYEIDEEGFLSLGSIALCTKRAQEQAEEYGHSYEREINYLIVHGICHLLGHDHETEEEKRQMRELEEKILTKMKITRG